MRERILAVIEKNSRISVKELADLLGENEAAVAAEIAEMENEHIICGYHTLINWDKTSEEKLTALPDAQVLDLYRGGAMGLVFLHLSSLGNLNRLLELINAREAAAPAQEAGQPLH